MKRDHLVIQTRALQAVTHVLVVLTSVLLVLEFWTATNNIWSLFLLLPGILWFMAHRWNLEFVDAVILVVYTFAAATGILAGSVGSSADQSFTVRGYHLLALLVVLFSLCTWQVAKLTRRIRFVQDEQIGQVIVKRHITRLSILIVASLLASILAMTIHFELNFGYILALGLLLVIALSQLIGFLFRESPS